VFTYGHSRVSKTFANVFQSSCRLVWVLVADDSLFEQRKNVEIMRRCPASRSSRYSSTKESRDTGTSRRRRQRAGGACEPRADSPPGSERASSISSVASPITSSAVPSASRQPLQLVRTTTVASVVGSRR
jgi:hypothetical protein